MEKSDENVAEKFNYLRKNKKTSQNLKINIRLWVTRSEGGRFALYFEKNAPAIGKASDRLGR